VKSTLEEIREIFREMVTERGLGQEPVEVVVGTLTPQQAIGSPKRQDYPLLEGREVMIEARFRGRCGQAFTDHPGEFKGPLDEVLNLSLDSTGNRALFDVTLNAVMAYLGRVEGVRHCHDEEPEKCAAEMAQYILEKYGRIKIGMIGYQPAILENLVKVFGVDNVHCTDLNPKNTGTRKHGAEIWDGRTDTEKLINWSDIVLATSSTIVNNTYDGIKALVETSGKRLIIFGVTGAGVTALLGLERLCFQPH
jgi:uncharacterized protein (DUF4213/DUF364 family)